MGSDEGTPTSGRSISSRSRRIGSPAIPSPTPTTPDMSRRRARVRRAIGRAARSRRARRTIRSCTCRGATRKPSAPGSAGGSARPEPRGSRSVSYRSAMGVRGARRRGPHVPLGCRSSRRTAGELRRDDRRHHAGGRLPGRSDAGGSASTSPGTSGSGAGTGSAATRTRSSATRQGRTTVRRVCCAGARSTALPRFLRGAFRLVDRPEARGGSHRFSLGVVVGSRTGLILTLGRPRGARAGRCRCSVTPPAAPRSAGGRGPGRWRRCRRRR